MKIATWNVNSLKVRLTHLGDWLHETHPDVVALQETKVDDPLFPKEAIEALGYHVVFSGQKTYNGVALLSKLTPQEVQKGIPDFEDEQKRVIAASYGDVRVINAYIPNGQSVGSDKFHYKLRWLEAFKGYLRNTLTTHARLIVLGDFNIAPDDRDVHDPKAWIGSVLVSPEERQAFSDLVALGFVDSLRLYHQDIGPFTWWDYRMNGFKRNLGLRIDHILISTALAPQCTDVEVDIRPRQLERPSDHTPVIASLNRP
jgi:exodeoxyribonuclease-3